MDDWLVNILGQWRRATVYLELEPYRFVVGAGSSRMRDDGREMHLVLVLFRRQHDFSLLMSLWPCLFYNEDDLATSD